MAFPASRPDPHSLRYRSKPRVETTDMRVYLLIGQSNWRTRTVPSSSTVR